MDHHSAGEAFIELLAAIEADGATHHSRVGSTRELLHQTVTLARPLERCIVVPHRNNDVFAAIAETVWVIAGRADIEFLTRYVKRAPEFSDDGVQWRAGYGPRLRDWDGTVDQLAAVVAELQANPESRRAVISLFDPSNDLVPTKDVPCTNWLQFVLRDGVLSLAVTVRSNDLFWGFSGINTFEWSVLHEMVASWLGASVGAVTFFIGSLHVYERHFARIEQILTARPGPELYPVPPAVRFNTPFEELDAELAQWFDVERGIRASDLSGVAGIRDPLLRDFAWMLAADAAAKQGDLDAAVSALGQVADTALVAAARDTLRWRNDLPTDKWDDTVGGTLPEDLSRYLMSLHREKTAGYGDSWKKRGEAAGILPNVDRKIDRLVVLDAKPAATTESLLDTAVDLFVYAVKYKTFLLDQDGSTLRGGTWSDGVEGFEEMLPEIVRTDAAAPPTVTEVATLVTAIEDALAAGAERADRIALADDLIADTWALLLETARMNEGATYREFARQRRAESNRLGAPPAVPHD